MHCARHGLETHRAGYASNMHACIARATGHPLASAPAMLSMCRLAPTRSTLLHRNTPNSSTMPPAPSLELAPMFPHNPASPCHRASSRAASDRPLPAAAALAGPAAPGGATARASPCRDLPATARPTALPRAGLASATAAPVWLTGAATATAALQRGRTATADRAALPLAGSARGSGSLRAGALAPAPSLELAASACSLPGWQPAQGPDWGSPSPAGSPRRRRLGCAGDRRRSRRRPRTGSLPGAGSLRMGPRHHRAPEALGEVALAHHLAVDPDGPQEGGVSDVVRPSSKADGRQAPQTTRSQPGSNCLNN